MNPHAAVFACKSQRFPFPRFMGERGLEQILIDAEQGSWSATVLATQVLVGCCVTDGRFNNFQVGLLAVMRFLSET
jgi:hypothetical protein